MKKVLFLTATLLLFFTSCEKENLTKVNNSESVDLEIAIEQQNEKTNWEIIYEYLMIFIANNDSRNPSQYFCSEISGGYTSMQYLTQGYHLNSYYRPARANTDLQDIFNTDFQSANPGGNYSAYVDFSFDIYGANGGTYLDATDSNRLYNEVVCQLDDINTSASRTYNISFLLDYFLCCNGSSCCNPILNATGIMYWD